MKNFIKEDTTIFLKHIGYEIITENLKSNTKTLIDFLLSKAEKFSDNKLLGAINKNLEIEFMSFNDFVKCSKKFGKYLAKISKPREIIGIASLNRPEWLIAEQAIYFCNCVNSPLYTTFKEDALSYIISITEMRVLIASPSFAKMVVEKAMEFIPSEIMKLEYIILMENDDDVAKVCTDKGLHVISLNEILFGDESEKNDFYLDPNFTICSKASKYFFNHSNDLDEINDEERGMPKLEDLASICFTSGTTGVPKGVQLTHSNFISQIEAFSIASENNELLDMSSEDVYFSYLPLSHVLERACIYFCLFCGAKICFFRGDKLKIGEDLNIIKPSLFASVPKVLQTFYSKIEEEVSKKKFYERFIYKSAVAFKIFLQRFNIQSVKILDEKIFKKVAANFGGNIREMLCGGASVDPYLIKYFTAVFSANIFQGYGQTEGLGANLLVRRNMCDSNTVGVPFPSTKVKLVSLDSQNNGHSSEKSLLLKGPCIMTGYFIPSDGILKKLLDTGKFNFKIENIKENPFDEDGWLITGDVVTYKENKIYIIGRNKDLVKLNNGEYISPENIENKLLETNYIKDVFISKLKGEDAFVAVVSVPEDNVCLMKIANYLKSSIESLISKKIFPKFLEITKFAVIQKNFNEIAGGTLFTPTLKKKRFLFEQTFEKEIKNAFIIENILNGDPLKNKKGKKIPYDS